MSVWVFVLILQLPSFGGAVTATVTAQTYDACVKLRTLVLDNLGGREENLRGSLSPCAVAAPARPQGEP